MKLKFKAAGLCATGAFVVATYPAVFRSEDPLVILSNSIPAAIVLGLLGYVMGEILSNPKGHLERRGRGGNAPKKRAGQAAVGKKATVTGEESFLDDMPEPAEALPIEPSKAEED